MADLPPLPGSPATSSVQSSGTNTLAAKNAQVAAGVTSDPTWSYYPRWKLRLVIRFDEMGDAGQLTKKVPTTTTKNLNGVNPNRGLISVLPDPSAPAGVSRYLLQPSNGSPVGTIGGPQQQRSSSDAFTHVVGGIVPKSFEWNQNGLRAAQTLRCELAYVDLPFDPRIVRACAVEFYLGTVSAAAHFNARSSSARAGETEIVDPDDLMLPDSFTAYGGVQVSNRVFSGWVDKWTAQHGDEGSWVELDCVANDTLLINQEVAPKLVLSMKDPIDKAIATYLSNFPQMAGLTVEYRPYGEPVPTLEGQLQTTAFRPDLGPPASKGGGGNSKLSLLDYLTDVARSIGHTVRFEGDVLVIQQVRTMTSAAVAKRVDDPFPGRSLGIPQLIVPQRRFVLGANVKAVKFERSFAKQQPTNVEVRCYQAAKKRQLVARFPSKADRQAYALPGDAGPDEKWTVYTVQGVSSQDAMTKLAQGIYESLGRQELHVEIKTKVFSSFGGGNADPDLCTMRFGDAVEILTRRDDPSSIASIESNLTDFQRGVNFLKSLGFDEGLARAAMNAQTSNGVQSIFRVRTLKVHGDNDQGVEFTIGAVNYTEVRADKALPAGLETGVGAPAAPPGTQPTVPGTASGGFI